MTAHWGVPDPAAVEGTEAEKRLAFADTYRMMKNRISIFVNLPMPSLDRLSPAEETLRHRPFVIWNQSCPYLNAISLSGSAFALLSALPWATHASGI